MSKESQDLILQYMKILVEVARESFLILDSDLRVVAANNTFYKTFEVSPAETENILLFELGNGQWNISSLKSLLREVLPTNKEVKDYEVKHVFEDIGEKTILLNAKEISLNGSGDMILLSMEDMTNKRKSEQSILEYTIGLQDKIVEREEMLIKIFELLPVGITIVDKQGGIAYLNNTTVKLTGISKERYLKGDYKKIKYLKGDDAVYETGFIKEDGEKIWLNVNSSKIDFKNWETINVYTDITSQKNTEQKLSDKVKDLERFNESMVDRELKMIDLKKQIEILTSV